MKLLSKLLNMSKKAKVAVAAVAALTVLGAGAAVYAGFGPANRQVFDWNVNPGTCDLDAATNAGDRCGSVTGPVFNSFINTPSYGDERNFARVAEVVPGQSPQDASYSESQTATAGKEYWVRTLVHNDANQNINCAPEHRDQQTNDCTQIDPGSKGIATNTSVRVAIPTGLVNGADIASYVSADNAAPKEVYDTTTLVNDSTAFTMNYVAGSATLYSDVHPGGVALPDSVTTTGALVGDDLNGNVPGCFNYAAYVYVKVKVSTPNLQLNKEVRLPGETEWHETVDAKPGDTVQWLIKVQNNGDADMHHMVASDLLPPHLQYVDGSAKWYSTSNNGVAYDFDQLEISDGDGGYDFGNYAGGGSGFLVRFDTKVLGDFDPCTILLTNVAHSKSTENPNELTDYANVRVTKENCNETTPKYSCDLLTLTKLGDRHYSYKVNFTATGGATLKSFTYNFGDGSTPLTTDKNPVEYTYQKDGTYAAKVTVNFTIDGVDKTATSADCAKPITVTHENCKVPGKEHLPVNSPECKPTTPPTPPVLPNTGSGDVLGIFAAVSIAGAFIHRFVLSRRFQ